MSFFEAAEDLGLFRERLQCSCSDHDYGNWGIRVGPRMAGFATGLPGPDLQQPDECDKIHANALQTQSHMRKPRLHRRASMEP